MFDPFKKTSESVFRENRRPPTMNFQFSYGCDLEN